MNLGLQNKVAFIAGSSRGIGLSVARAFLQEDAKVAITGRNADSLKDAQNLLSEEFQPRNLLSLQGDMTDPLDIRRTFDETVSSFGGVDTVVANIGDGSKYRGWNLTLDDWQSVLKTNLLGSMTLASTSFPHLAARGKGSLTFISSITGCETIPSSLDNAPLAYSAAKAAVQSAMKNLSRLAGPKNFRVNAVSPGNVLVPGGEWERKLSEKPEFFKSYIRSEVPLQRFGSPEEIADMVVFLASERASFVTGTCVVVDGGQTRSF